MSARLSLILIALSGILGTALLGTYFGVGFSAGLAQLPPDATTAQVVRAATQYHNLWFLGTWLQATGSLLSVVFFIALVQRAGAAAQLAGLLTILGSAVLLAVVLIEGVFTIDLAQAAVNGHQVASLTSFDIMTVFTYIYPIVPAPVIFLALGTVLLGSHLLPRVFGYLALGLGIAFEIVGFVGLFTTPVLTLVALSLQALWVLAAAITLLVRTGMASNAPAEATPL
ncbi:MAG TPA: hypothetical protein VF026_00795 [Ktedonobacteraceae bacterium]